MFIPETGTIAHPILRTFEVANELSLTEVFVLEFINTSQCDLKLFYTLIESQQFSFVCRVLRKFCWKEGQRVIQ